MPTLFFVCGKIASGKSTLAAKLAGEHRAVLFVEDALSSALWPGELTSAKAYAERWPRLYDALGPVIVRVLASGVSVALDFPGNTHRQRARMRALVEESGAEHELHWLDLPDDECKARLRRRNAEGQHEYAPTDEDFDLFSKYFQPPEASEGLNIVVHRG